MSDTSPDQIIVLFDGECGLCTRSVRFFIRHDPDGILRFAPRLSPVGCELMKRAGLDAGQIDSMVLIEAGKAYIRSDATWRILRHLRGIPRLLSWIRIVPRPIRDWGYRWIAQNRHRWSNHVVVCDLDDTDIVSRKPSMPSNCIPK